MDLTHHLLSHTSKSLDDNCEYCEIYQRSHDNLFSANHRNAMLTRNSFTSAQFVTIEDLL